MDNSNSKITLLFHLGITPRVQRCLFQNGITSVEKLLALSAEELVRIPGVGKKTYWSILDGLEANGYDTAKFPREAILMSYPWPRDGTRS